MKKIAFFVAVGLVFCLANQAEALYNYNAKFQLHYAGPHDSKAHTCAFTVTTCSSEIVVNGGGAGRYDIYIMAIDTNGIAGSRYGLACDGDFYFYGWTNCSDFEIPSTNWGTAGMNTFCGEGNAHAWSAQQPAGHVVMGILDVYVYPTGVSLCTDVDPRKGFGEWCDASAPEPLCNETTEVAPALQDLYFGCVGFNGTSGVSRCDIISTEEFSWGRIKTLYR